MPSGKLERYLQMKQKTGKVAPWCSRMSQNSCKHRLRIKSSYDHVPSVRSLGRLLNIMKTISSSVKRDNDSPDCRAIK